MARKVFSFISFLVVLISISACAPTLKYESLTPARYHEATTIRQLSVLPFSGERGEYFAIEIEGVLAGVRIYDQPYFTMVERAKAENILMEMKLSRSALIDENTAIQLGKMIGAKGLYTGVVHREFISDNAYQETRRRCIKRTEQQNSNLGASILLSMTGLDCIEWEYYKVDCTASTATFEFTPKLLEVVSGRVIFEKTYADSLQSTKCTDQIGGLDGNALLRQTKEKLKNDFKRDVAPNYISLEVRIMDSTQGLSSETAIEKFKEGVEFAAAQRIDRACNLWQEVRSISEATMPLLYNMGICSEINGNIEEAAELYKEADLLLKQPDKHVNTALARIKGIKENDDLLKEQIANLKPQR